MKSLFQATFILLAAFPPPALATPEQDADFAARCASPGVVRCVGFDSSADIPIPTDDYVNDPAPLGLVDSPYVTPELDTTSPASGGSALKFTIPSNTGAAHGAYFLNFSDDFSVQFGEGSPHGKEFYVQWRQKFSPAFIDTNFRKPDAGTWWKQVIVGEGDRPDENIYSCTPLEIVVDDGGGREFAQIYHSCGAKDSNYEPLSQPADPYDFLLQNAMPDPGCRYQTSNGSDPKSNNCVFYEANQWMTFQLHVIIGTPYQNNGVYKHDSTIQLWVAYEGQPSTLVIDFSPKDPGCQAVQTSIPGCDTGYDLYNDDPLVQQYGQVWLTPYMTGKDSGHSHPTAYTWYDELIVSTSRIADPGVPGDTLAPAAPTGVDVQ